MSKKNCTHICPYCFGRNTFQVHEARTVSSIAGGLIGLAVGAVKGKDLPGTAGVNIAIAGVAGALSGFYTGCLIGKKLGENFDENILEKRSCMKCQRTFYS